VLLVRAAVRQKLTRAGSLNCPNITTIETARVYALIVVRMDRDHVHFVIKSSNGYFSIVSSRLRSHPIVNRPVTCQCLTDQRYVIQGLLA
jgi:hypothetical protein